MVNWSNIEKGDCKECGKQAWKKIHEEETERSDPSDVNKAFYQCLQCKEDGKPGVHGRIFEENGCIVYSAWMEEP